MINCIIIDDEQHAIDLIRSFCEKIPYLNINGEFLDPLEAVPYLKNNETDLVFLDINMHNITGFDFLKIYQIKNVILTTAYSEYALDSYEYGVIDYLLKPISFERFLSATQKILNTKRKEITEFSFNLNKERSFFYIKTDRDKTIRLNISEIIYIEGLKNYINIHTIRDKVITLMSMKNIEEQLPSDIFKRVQKSYIINLDFFDSLEGNQIRLTEFNGTIPLGNTYKSEFLEVLSKNTIK